MEKGTTWLLDVKVTRTGKARNEITGVYVSRYFVPIIPTGLCSALEVELHHRRIRAASTRAHQAGEGRVAMFVCRFHALRPLAAPATSLGVVIESSVLDFYKLTCGCCVDAI